MAYGQNDPATDRRISRLSLLSSAATLHAGKVQDPDIVLTTAKGWETWVYEGHPAASGNGTTTFPVDLPVPTLAPVCAECGNPITPVVFKKGNTWPVEQLVAQGQAKYGKALCKTHYFGKKTA